MYNGRLLEPCPRKLLCVDDSEDIRELFVRALRGRQDLQCAGTLSEATDLAGEVTRSGADVVILDLTLPGNEPEDAIRSVRSRCPGCQVVVYTGRNDPETVRRAMDAGAACVVGKSATILEVLERAKGVATLPGA